MKISGHIMPDRFILSDTVHRGQGNKGGPTFSDMDSDGSGARFAKGSELATMEQRATEQGIEWALF